MTDPQPTTQPKDPHRNWAIAMYSLFIAGLLIPFLPLIALIVALVKRKTMAGTIYESHCLWIAYTFLYAFLFSLAAIVLGMSFSMHEMPWSLRVVVGLWVLYRLVKGALNLRDRQPAVNPKAII